MRHLVLTMALMLTGAAAWAEGQAALILGSSSYRQLPTVSGGDQVSRIVRAFDDTEYDVSATSNPRRENMMDALAAFETASRGAEMIVISISGHFATVGGEPYVLGTDARNGSYAEVVRAGVPLAAILELAKRAPGKAVVALGVPQTSFIAGRDVISGLGRLTIPRGVTVLVGSPRDMGQFLRREALEPGVSLSRAVRRTEYRISARSSVMNLPLVEEVEPEPVLPNPEETYWKAVQDLGTADAYRAYLEAYPNGQFVGEARQRIRALSAPPSQTPAEVEQALSLTRAERRDIQRDLTTLGYDTRGVDGIFGGGTRAAIRNWQDSIAAETTGFLDAAQIAALDAQAELRAEEARQRAAEEAARLAREEEDLFARAEQSGSPDLYREYLRRFPEGRFVQTANLRLQPYIDAEEREAWPDVVATNTVEGYEAHLETYPDGIYAEEAKTRIDELSVRVTPEQLAQAKREEDGIAFAPVTYLLVEQRLAALGLNPGRVDGRLTEQTRTAILTYQEARELLPTGYLDRATIGRLIEGATR